MFAPRETPSYSGREWPRQIGNFRRSAQSLPKILVGLALSATACWATKPYVPTSDSEVLETLPVDLFAEPGELAKLRERLARAPQNPDVVASVAARYIQLGSQSSDPRYFGYARAALGPWWGAADAPGEMLRLRAKIKEKNHDYQDALADLYLLLELHPQDPQGWIEASNILRVTGDYGSARRACDELSRFAGPFATALASIPLMAVTGQAEPAYQELQRLLPKAQRDYPGTVRWFRVMQAEVALALGRDAEAEGLLRGAIRSAPDDPYLLRAYADLLIDQGRFEEALAITKDRVTDDGLLLCAAIAAVGAGQNTEAAAWEQALAERFEAVRQRGDEPLGRFEARFALSVQKDPGRALRLALKNWEVQRETQDSRLVLEAALAAGAPQEAAPVVAFLKQHGAQHVRLDALMRELATR